jgi:hypothetical protein
MIDRSEIEAKAKEIEDAVGETRESVQNTAMMGAVAVVVLLIIAFLLGRRRGKKGSAVVEVYRI